MVRLRGSNSNIFYIKRGYKKKKLSTPKDVDEALIDDNEQKTERLSHGVQLLYYSAVRKPSTIRSL